MTDNNNNNKNKNMHIITWLNVLDGGVAFPKDAPDIIDVNNELIFWYTPEFNTVWYYKQDRVVIKNRITGKLYNFDHNLSKEDAEKFFSEIMDQLKKSKRVPEKDCDPTDESDD